MSESKHTPEQLIVHTRLTASENHRGFYITTVRGMTVCEVYPLDPDGKEGGAYAYLMAAAPALLKAAEDFVAKVERGEARSKRSYKLFKAAIAKSKGAQ